MGPVDAGRRRAVASLLSLPLLGVGGGVHARAVRAERVDAAIAAPAAAFMADPRAVGLSIGVLHGGMRRTRHAGTVDGDRHRAPDDRTIYPIASLTKTFTATLLAQAQHDGKLRLEDDIRLYLDGDYPNLVYEGQPIQVRYLVSHLSGLPRLLPDRPEAAPVLRATSRIQTACARSSRRRRGANSMQACTRPG
ncbi:serine hydrolase domain-containing protein [Massilia sp. TN1-12]|uniref:serine hydrolase domain-containing protein n=1 Tax=Massilia paldalensis TaxID=3377675 RepID=UPI00384B5D5E